MDGGQAIVCHKRCPEYKVPCNRNRGRRLQIYLNREACLWATVHHRTCAVFVRPQCYTRNESWGRFHQAESLCISVKPYSNRIILPCSTLSEQPSSQSLCVAPALASPPWLRHPSSHLSGPTLPHEGFCLPYLLQVQMQAVLSMTQLSPVLLSLPARP